MFCSRKSMLLLLCCLSLRTFALPAHELNLMGVGELLLSRDEGGKRTGSIIFHYSFDKNKWRYSPLNTDEALVDMSCVGRNCLAGGSDNHLRDRQLLLYRSTDGGESWVPSSQPLRQLTNEASVNNVQCVGQPTQCNVLVGSYGYEHGYEGTIYHSSNLGLSWQATKIDGGVIDLSCGDKKSLNCTALVEIVTGPDQVLTYETLSSQDGGATWSKPVELPSSLRYGFNPPAISCAGNHGLTCALVGTGTSAESNAPAAFYSEDGGKSWAEVDVPFVQHSRYVAGLFHVACGGQDGKTCVATGAGNIAKFTVRSEDGGKTWTVFQDPQLQTPYGNLNNMSCSKDLIPVCIIESRAYDNKTGSITGYFYSSKDGGKTWSQPIFAADDYDIGSMSFVK